MSDTKKTAAPKKPAEHPTYIEMVKAAIAALKDRTGSSRQAILKYIQANYKVKDNAPRSVNLALKKGVAAGVLSQPKGTGASGSFKVVKKAEPKKKPAAKKPAAKKPAAKKPAKKTATPKKKAAAKKTTKKTPTKKKTPKKTAAKKPAKKPATKKPAKKTPKKSAKKPAAKKAKK